MKPEEKNDVSKNQIIKNAEERYGIQANLIPLSNFTLSNTIKVLPKLQKEFRQLFAQFISHNELESLDGQERVVYRRVWNIWYLFTSQPDLRLKNPSQKSANRFDHTKKRIRNNLKKELRSISSERLGF